jgi:large subunit ribosomal protein L30
MKLKVTQIRSTIGRKEDQKRTITALGLGKINRSRTHDDNPVIRGMINKVIHLVSVEEIVEKAKKKTVRTAKPKVADKVTDTKVEVTEKKTVKKTPAKKAPVKKTEKAKTKKTAVKKTVEKKPAAKKPAAKKTVKKTVKKAEKPAEKPKAEKE